VDGKKRQLVRVPLTLTVTVELTETPPTQLEPELESPPAALPPSEAPPESPERRRATDSKVALRAATIQARTYWALHLGSAPPEQFRHHLQEMVAQWGLQRLCAAFDAVHQRMPRGSSSAKYHVLLQVLRGWRKAAEESGDV